MIRKIKASEGTKMTRNKPSRFEGTEDWRDLQAKIDKGLKPNEGWEVEFTKEDQKRHRITNRRTVARFVRAYIQSRKMPYQVDSFNVNGGAFLIRVKYLPVLNRTA